MAHVVIDKSYLDAARPNQVKSLCDKHTVLMPDVLFYELITTRKLSRKHCFNKFPDTNNPVELIPNVGSLLRFELNTHRPCTPLYDHREKIVFNFHKGLRADTFQFTDEQLESKQNQEGLISQHSKTFFKLAMMVHVFFPHLNGISYSDFPEAVQEAKQQVATNVEKVREIYASLLDHDAPSNAVNAGALDPDWACFRWIQVRVIYSLNLLLRYQGQLPANTSEKFWLRIEHDMLDTEYVILGSLAGALASKDKKVIENFLLVHPDGLLFTLES